MGESKIFPRKRGSNEVHSETKGSKGISKRRNVLGSADHDDFPTNNESTIGFGSRLSNQVFSRADTQPANPLLDLQHQTRPSIENGPPQTIIEILKARKKELCKKYVEHNQNRNEKGRLQVRIPLIDDIEATNGFLGDLVVKRNKKSASPYFVTEKGKPGLLDDVGKGDGSTFIDDLKEGIRSQSFSDLRAKELYAITLLEGMRIQYAYTRFSEALEKAKSDRKFIKLFRGIPYTKKGGAKTQREERVRDDGEETDADEAPHWYRVFTAKQKQLADAKLVKANAAAPH